MFWRRHSDQEVVLRVSRLPALVQPEGLLALVIAFRVQALLTHLQCNILHGSGEHVMELFQVHLSVVVQYVGLVEDAVHVALEILVLVDLTVAELLDGLCDRQEWTWQYDIRNPAL